MGAEELPHEPQPQIHLIACFLVLTRTCPLVVQTATSAFDGVDEMRLHSVCCLLSVWSRDNEGLNGAWVQAGTRPLLIHSHSSMLCGDLLSLKYRCDPRTKAAVCSVISSPKLVFLIAFCCVYLSRTWARFFFTHTQKKSTSSFVWNNKAAGKKSTTKGLWRLGTGVMACLREGSGLRLIEVWQACMRGDLVLSSSDKLQGELEEKQAVSSEEQCGIESRSADCPNPSAAGVSCAPSCMNGVDCVKFLWDFLSHTDNVFGLFISLR